MHSLTDLQAGGRYDSSLRAYFLRVVVAGWTLSIFSPLSRRGLGHSRMERTDTILRSLWWLLKKEKRCMLCIVLYVGRNKGEALKGRS